MGDNRGLRVKHRSVTKKTRYHLVGARPENLGLCWGTLNVGETLRDERGPNHQTRPAD